MDGKTWLYPGLLAITLWLVTSVPVFAVADCSATATGHLADLSSRPVLQHFVRCAMQHVEEVGWDQAMQNFATDPQW